jgi:hypothetical protein
MTNRKPLIAGNWKMYKTISEAVETAREMVKLLKVPPNAEVMIAPGYVLLNAVRARLIKVVFPLEHKIFFGKKKGLIPVRFLRQCLFRQAANMLSSGIRSDANILLRLIIPLT